MKKRNVTCQKKGNFQLWDTYDCEIPIAIIRKRQTGKSVTQEVWGLSWASRALGVGLNGTDGPDGSCLRSVHL